MYRNTKISSQKVTTPEKGRGPSPLQELGPSRAPIHPCSSVSLSGAWPPLQELVQGRPFTPLSESESETRTLLGLKWRTRKPAPTKGPDLEAGQGNTVRRAGPGARGLHGCRRCSGRWHWPQSCAICRHRQPHALPHGAWDTAWTRPRLCPERS